MEAELSPCPNCRRLEAEVAELRAQLRLALERIARLEEQNRLLLEQNRLLQERNQQLEAELRRGKRQAAPFSKERPKKEKKRPGRKPGKGRFHFQQPPPEAQIQDTVPVPLPACPACGGGLRERREHEHFQVDLPEITPVWRRFVTQSGFCEHCRCRVHSRHPEQISGATGAAGVSVGPRAKALAADLKHRLGVPWRKITDLYSVAFGLQVTASALYQADVRLAGRLEVVYWELAQALRQAAQVHADETGWRIGLLPCWLWVFANAEVTVYAISDRSHEVVLRVLGREFRGVLTSDCFTAYDARALREWVQQKCLAHLIRAASELDQQKTRGAVRFPRAVAALFREALDLGKERAALETEVFARRRAEIEERLDRLIDARRHFTDPDNGRLAKRLRKQRRHLLTFLGDGHPALEATNNRAERMLRPGVITRKTGGCNRSRTGARTHEVLASVLVSLRQQGRDLLGYLSAALLAPGLPPRLSSPPAPATP